MNEMNDRISGNHADAVNYYAGRAGSDSKCSCVIKTCELCVTVPV